MSEKLVTVAQFTDYMQAELAKQLLADEGIVAFVMGQHSSTIYAGVPGIVNIALQTPESQAQRAKEVLEASSRQRDEASELAADEDFDQDWVQNADPDGCEDTEQE